MEFLREELANYFHPALGNTVFTHPWELTLEFSEPDGHTVTDNFQASTTVSVRDSNQLEVETRINNARVQSQIIINYLDYYTTKMVELWRIAD
jgi:hypothetical protein